MRLCSASEKAVGVTFFSLTNNRSVPLAVPIQDGADFFLGFLTRMHCACSPMSPF